jgi:hypothetical protein
MCCRDGNEAIWQMPYEAARWLPEAGGSFLGLGQSAPELPTAAAELEIEVVVIRAEEGVEDTAPPGWPRGAA